MAFRGSPSFQNASAHARDLAADLLVALLLQMEQDDQDDLLQRLVAILQAVMGRVAGIRHFGAAALDLAYVAAGRFDGFWEYGLHPWDIAAGILLVREAGGFVSDLSGGGEMLATGDVVAGNGHLHQPLLEILRAADPGPSPAADGDGKSHRSL